MALLEFEGKNLEEAIENAAVSLSLPAEKLKFTIMSMGSKGFLGLGRRKARIGINSEDQSNDSPGDLTGPAAEEAQESIWAASEKKRHCGDSLDLMHEAAPSAPRPVRDKAKERRGRERQERPAGPPRAQEPGEAPALDFSHLPPPPTQPAPGETVREGDDPIAAEARAILAGMLEKMGFSADINAQRIAGRVVLKLADSDDNALLIGSRGSTLEALELLLGRILIKKLKEAENPEAADLKVIVDAADYRARRQAAILDSLRGIAAQVRRGRKPQSMNGLSASERRLVQLALRPARDLSYRNDAPRDCVIISLYNAKEKK